MNRTLIVLFFFYTVVKCKFDIKFMKDRIIDSVKFKEIEFYKNKYDCFDENTTSAQIMTFDFYLINKGKKNFHLNFGQEVKLHYNITNISNNTSIYGVIKYNCLRDYDCKEKNKYGKYFSCSNEGISPGCYSLIDHNNICKWIQLSVNNDTHYMIEFDLYYKNRHLDSMIFKKEAKIPFKREGKVNSVEKILIMGYFTIISLIIIILPIIVCFNLKDNLLDTKLIPKELKKE